ncbi:protein AGENET DOMAIN (AGD)-CONTAINING P1-like [Bidens hawaiensis]|uniref:protein AGENET DOMAIN (AGD)-CONTAINING P1-like n=1 Tax=Bidens hawaiensis TaxID=980011 RepID=UPI00404B9A08
MTRFKRGDRVEVMDLGSGFIGSYYDGNIISTFSNEYIVQFRTLLENDQSGPLREFVKAKKVRPKPAFVEVSSFRLGETVDVYANGGWWTRRIISKFSKSEYVVHFDSTNQDITYPFPNIRVHQEWDAANEVWVYARN